MSSDSFDPKDASKEERGPLSEALKKVFSTGSAPKEILGVALQIANKSKDEITQRVSKEVVQIFQKIDWVKEFSKFAENHKFKISAEIEITKKNSSDDIPNS